MNTKKINNLQFLRGLCALSVFFSHIPCFHISNGQIGVAIFMIMSAFFSMKSTENNKNNVLMKKLLKIVPLYWTMTLLIYIITLIKPDLLYSTTGSVSYLIKSLLFIPFNMDNKMGHGPLLNVGWYLEIDIYYMIIFAIFSKFFYKKRLEYTTFYLLIMFLIGLFFKFDNYLFTAYTSYCLIYFVIGLCSYKIYKNDVIVNKFQVINKKNLPLLSILLFFILMYFFEHEIISTILVSILFILFLFNDKGIYPKLGILYGNISFPFYLVHYFVIAVFDRILFSLDTFSFKTLILICAVFIITFIISYFVNKLLNKFDKFIKEKTKILDYNLI